MAKAFQQRRVWASLKRNPGSKAADVAERINRPVSTVSSILSRMHADGHARREGFARGSRWWAAGKEPDDHRGCSANSIANLEQTPEERAATLRLANLAKGLDPDKMAPSKPRKARQRYTGELERCWSMPFSTTQHAND